MLKSLRLTHSHSAFRKQFPGNKEQIHKIIRFVLIRFVLIFKNANKYPIEEIGIDYYTTV